MHWPVTPHDLDYPASTEVSLAARVSHEQAYTMAEDHDELYSDDREDDSISFNYAHDDFSELGPDDSASQIGRAITTNDEVYHQPQSPPRRNQTSEPFAHPYANGTHIRAFSRPEVPYRPEPPNTPPSRRTSIRSSRMLTPTTFVPSKTDRVRYSWQSIHGDEPDRPRIHVVKIVSNNATASAGFPQVEAFGFSISSGGRRIAAYNSARLFVLQTAALPINISQEYALRRRPLAVEILDEGDILAVLADEHTVNVYDLSHHRVRRIKTIQPDFPTNTIALSPTGGLLAAAYEGGIEIFSLDPDALSTDRRAVRSPKMDRLVFSDDASTLLGTTTRINAAATVVVSVPVFPAASDGVPTHEELKEAWCSGLLDPENIVNSSHATFMRENGLTCNEKLFAWNGSDDTFGILNTADLEYGNTDFPVTISPPLSTCGGLGAAIHSVPVMDEHGDTVGMIVNDRTIRLYIVPRNTDEETKVEAHSIDHELDEEFGCPFSDVRWVHSHASLPAPAGSQAHVKGRLVVVSPGGVVAPDIPEDSIEDIEGGRIILFDFDPQFAGQPGQTFTLTLGKAPPQTLHEEELNVAQEVALVRRRTVNQSKNGKLNQRAPVLGRAASTVNSARHSPISQQPSERSQSPNGSIQQSPIANHPPLAFASRRNNNHSSLSLSLDANNGLPDVVETNETIEEPYTHNAPRSNLTMQRAASAASRHRIQTFEERAAEVSSTEGLGLLPLPEYTEEPNTPLPGRYRAMAGLDAARSKAGDRSSKADPALASSPDISASPAISPLRGGRTLNTVASLSALTASVTPQPSFGAQVPRALQRAYSNAANTLGSGVTPPSLGAWEHGSPFQARGGHHAVHRSESLREVRSTHSQPSSVSPVPSATAPTFARPQEYPREPQRLSNSMFAPMPVEVRPMSIPSSSNTVPPSIPSPTTPHYPPLVAAFPSVDGISSTLYPTNANQRRHSAQPASSVPHPVTNWYPPAPSISEHAPGRRQRSSSSPGQDSYDDRASRRKGWFSGKKPPRQKDFDEARSWMANDEKRCTVM